MTRHRAGDPAFAEPVYRRALDSNPQDSETWHMLGVARLQQGDLEDAGYCVRHAISLTPTSAKFFNSLGNILNAQGMVAEALEAFEDALLRQPNFVEAAYNKGTLHLMQNQHVEAEQVFRDLLEVGGRSPDVYNNLGTAILRQYKAEQAIDICRAGLAKYPEALTLTTTLAYALEAANKMDEARDLLPDLDVAGRGIPLALVIQARILRRAKKLDAALAVIERVDADALPLVDRIDAVYEKGMILDALAADPADSFRYIKAYNELLAASPEAVGCDPDRYLAKVRAYQTWAERTVFTPEGPEADRSTPVFFIGFPRSGTTLMEQALKAHPQILTTEEASPLTPVEQEARRLAAQEGKSFPACLDDWDEERFVYLRCIFDEAAEEVVGPLEGRVLVDKLPMNIVPMGLAAKLWPQARIIMALRDPRDSCLSCFVQRFKLNDAMANFLDVEQTGKAYAQVMGLWLTYRARLGLPYLEYRYEDLVEDFGGTIRNVLNFIGVGWHDDVADYREKTKKSVIRTPSYRQVTAAVHTGAVARWRRYAVGLAPMQPHLAPFVKAFGYDQGAEITK